MVLKYYYWCIELILVEHSFYEKQKSAIVPWNGQVPYQYDIDYETRFNKYLIGTKWVFGGDFRKIQPYITPQIGYVGFKTKYSYVDFDHPVTKTVNQYGGDGDSDDPIIGTKQVTTVSDKTIISQKSGVCVYGGQIGVELSLSNILHKSKVNDDRFIISATYLQSSQTLSYTNMDYLRHVAVNESNQSTINFPTNSTINEPASTAVYHTKMMIWGINVGYVFNF